MKIYTSIKQLINNKLLDNLLLAHRKVAEKGSVKSLIILTKFILKFSKKFGNEEMCVKEEIYFDEPIGIDEEV